ncbi:hypothetical protein ZHAS_00009126 [Anopheles sinensis]|uniref:Uncharacterized protein n=1 Tax=Anopheles sinensis TaxID=74873 RepID=A0A084VU77_ANOSI|nr:hypothetical protein ZHAS_00009126 [Anopheles sinensis]
MAITTAWATTGSGGIGIGSDARVECRGRGDFTEQLPHRQDTANKYGEQSNVVFHLSANSFASNLVRRRQNASPVSSGKRTGCCLPRICVTYKCMLCCVLACCALLLPKHMFPPLRQTEGLRRPLLHHLRHVNALPLMCFFAIFLSVFFRACGTGAAVECTERKCISIRVIKRWYERPTDERWNARETARSANPPGGFMLRRWRRATGRKHW